MATGFVINATSGKATIIKDPNAVLDYTFDWTAWLADIADTISTKAVTAAAGLTVDSSSIVGTTVVVWLSGGTVGETYEVNCRIVTAGGRTEDRRFYVKIKER